MKFLAYKENGKLTVNWDRVEVYLSRFKDGTRFDLEIVHRVKTKSDPMRNWYWGYVLPTLMEGLGYDKEDDETVHRQLKIVFFRVKQDKHGIYREKDIPSVFSNNSTLGIDEKKKFLDWVIRKAAENGIYIEDPRS